MKRSMLVSLLKNGSIKTTLAKARVLRPFTERMITRAKRLNESNNEVAVIRRLKKDLPLSAVRDLIERAKSYGNREGGYVRVVKLVARKSDAAEMALVQFVEVEASGGDAKVSADNGVDAKNKKDGKVTDEKNSGKKQSDKVKDEDVKDENGAEKKDGIKKKKSGKKIVMKKNDVDEKKVEKEKKEDDDKSGSEK